MRCACWPSPCFFGLDRICEELEAVTALAGDYQVPWELSDLVRRTYRRALARYGPVDGEYD